MAQPLEGKVAIVTGGAGVIGSAACRLLAERGARVVVADIDLAHAQVVAATLDDAIAVKVDLANEIEIIALFDATLNRYGQLDVIDNNAALLSPEIAHADHDVANMATDIWDSIFATRNWMGRLKTWACRS